MSLPIQRRAFKDELLTARALKKSVENISTPMPSLICRGDI
jgi:hypothetical protein